MCQYVRSNDRRLAAESKARAGEKFHAARFSVPLLIDGLTEDGPQNSLSGSSQPITVSGGGMAGMTPIVTPLAASGFGPRALSLLSDRLRPLGMAPMSGGAAPERIVREGGDRPLVPGSPLSIRHGDRGLRSLGHRHVTHVEGTAFTGSAIPCSAWVRVSFR